MNFNLNLSDANFLIINIFAALMGLYFIIKNKEKLKTQRNLSPTKLNFYEKSYFYKGANYIHNTIIAMLLYLKNKGAITIEKTTYKNRKGENILNYIFTKRDFSNLDSAEQKLLDIFFSFSDDDKISSRKLNKLRKDAPDDYNRKFYNLIEYFENHFENLGLKKNTSSSNKILIYFLGFFILFGIGLVFVANGHYYGFINMILSLVFFGLSISSVAELPPMGKKQFEELSILEKNLKKLNITTEDPTLVAIGFGLKYENIIAIREKNNDDYDIYFDENISEFQKVIKTALVGNSFLVR
ncbi:hypothetical protein ABID14_000568 [Peptoniphilus olsenii]|uniref:Predicted membrane protein YciQ-like C-terminal domain-containing protein n=1 Tax=Peptoniphilus olsenii TaxID=411570 RepID=A0ABV2J870_9FIRM